MNECNFVLYWGMGFGLMIGVVLTFILIKISQSNEKENKGVKK